MEGCCSLEDMVKRILVTGSEGFIGGHLVKILLNKNYKVTATYLKKSGNSQLFNTGLDSKVRVENLNVLDRRHVFDVILKHKIELVIHLAAKTQVTDAYENPYSTIKTNALGTLNVLEAARRIGNVGVIFASSDKAYGTSPKVSLEGDSLRGKYPYDVSKSSADLIAQSYAKTYNLPLVVTRLGNVYGAWDMNFDRLIPGFCRAMYYKKIFLIRSSGKYIRDYIHIDDAISAYMLLIKKFSKTVGEVFNISGQDSLSPLLIIKIIEKELGKEINYKILDKANAEIVYQHLNSNQIRKLGSMQKYPFKNKIKDVIDWYFNYFSKNV